MISQTVTELRDRLKRRMSRLTSRVENSPNLEAADWDSTKDGASAISLSVIILNT